MTPTTSVASDRVDTSRADLEGSLRDLPLSELLDLLAATRKTGSIELGEPVGATLWVHEGHLAYGASPGSATPAELLVAAGVVTSTQFDGAVTATGPDQSLTETLVDLFDADRAAIEAIAREQVITTVFEVLVVGADRFAFRGDEPDPLGAPVTPSHAEILAEADRRRVQWQRIAELIPSTGIVVELNRELPDGRAGITVTADEWQVLALLDGYRTVGDVIAELGQSAFEVCGVLYELLRAGTVVVQGSEEETDEDVIDVG